MLCDVARVSYGRRPLRSKHALLQAFLSVADLCGEGTFCFPCLFLLFLASYLFVLPSPLANTRHWQLLSGLYNQLPLSSNQDSAVVSSLQRRVDQVENLLGAGELLSRHGRDLPLSHFRRCVFLDKISSYFLRIGLWFSRVLYLYGKDKDGPIQSGDGVGLTPMEREEWGELKLQCMDFMQLVAKHSVSTFAASALASSPPSSSSSSSPHPSGSKDGGKDGGQRGGKQAVIRFPRPQSGFPRPVDADDASSSAEEVKEEARKREAKEEHEEWAKARTQVLANVLQLRQV